MVPSAGANRPGPGGQVARRDEPRRPARRGASATVAASTASATSTPVEPERARSASATCSTSTPGWIVRVTVDAGRPTARDADRRESAGARLGGIERAPSVQSDASSSRGANAVTSPVSSRTRVTVAGGPVPPGLPRAPVPRRLRRGRRRSRASRRRVAAGSRCPERVSASVSNGGCSSSTSKPCCAEPRERAARGGGDLRADAVLRRDRRRRTCAAPSSRSWGRGWESHGGAPLARCALGTHPGVVSVGVRAVDGRVSADLPVRGESK